MEEKVKILAITQEPQSAADYDDRTTSAVKSVLIELGQILGSYAGKFALIGGMVPWLRLDNEEMRHVGTMDIDVALDAEALQEDAEYADLVKALLGNGFYQSPDARRFQLLRKVPSEDGDIEVVVDFLMPRNVRIPKRNPPIVEDFAVQRADGAQLALVFNDLYLIEGDMPEGGRNSVKVAVCTIPALLAMKGFAIANRHKRKDAYDIYYSIRNYPDGFEALAKVCQPVLEVPDGLLGFQHINDKFSKLESYGPTSVRQFVEETQALGERTPEQWQQDAFGQVDYLLRTLGIRK